MLQAVAGVLLEEGVDPARVRSFGRGENEPVATNLTPEGRQLNRRVEIFVKQVVKGQEQRAYESPRYY